jgi:hypothetical protein
MPERDGPEMATMWIREFMQATAKCDQFHDLSVRRAAWRNHLGEDAYNKIMSFDQTDPSVPERAAATLQHYLFYDRTSLVKGLDWSNWFGYQFIDRVQTTSAFIGLFGGSGAAVAWVFAKKCVRRQQYRPRPAASPATIPATIPAASPATSPAASPATSPAASPSAPSQLP